MKHDKYTLLVVDDDEDFLQDMRAMLSTEFDVIICPGTEEAMKQLQHSVPDCVLLDLNMPSNFGEVPGEEGLAFLSVIRAGKGPKGTRDIPVVIVSSHVTPDIHRKVNELRTPAITVKPPDIGDLIEEIRELVGEQYKSDHQ